MRYRRHPEAEWDRVQWPCVQWPSEEGWMLSQEPVTRPGWASARGRLTGLLQIALQVGSSHTSLDLILFQKLHQAQLL